MHESSDEEIILSYNDRSPRKKKKRKSKKKNFENAEDYNCIDVTQRSPAKSSRRTFKDIFKPSGNSSKFYDGIANVSSDEMIYVPNAKDQNSTSLLSQYTPLLKQKLRSGYKPVGDSGREKHSRHETRPMFNNDSSDLSSSLPDIYDTISKQGDNSYSYKTKSRSKSVELAKRNRSRQNHTPSPERRGSPSNKRHFHRDITSDLDNEPHENKEKERGRKLEKHTRHKRSTSRDFLDSEHKRDSFSAFMNLSQHIPDYKTSSLNRGNLPFTLNKTASNVDKQDITQKYLSQYGPGVKDQRHNDKISKETPLQSDYLERNTVDLSESQMANNTINDQSPTKRESIKKEKNDKRLDRGSYKSPRRFSGRSVSRERRKSGKPPENTPRSPDVGTSALTRSPKSNKTETVDQGGKVEAQKEIGLRNERKSEKVETKDSQTETGSSFSNLLSRSIQTSMNLLDIQDDKTENITKVDDVKSVPLIVEPSDIHINVNSEPSVPNDEIKDKTPDISSSSESEEFKTPKQSPLLDRKATSNDEIGSDKNDEKEKLAKKGSVKKSSKLSFLAVVALKRKIALHRKKKKANMEESEKKGDQDKTKNASTSKSKQEDIPKPEVVDKSETNKTKTDGYMTSYFIENETDFNIGNLSYLPETDIIDDELKKDVKLPDKKLSFDIVEPSASDEPIEKPYVHRHQQLAKRRQSEIFREKRKKALTYCKKFVAFLFSHIGLCSLMVAYAILGGFIFKALEGPFEIQTKLRVNNEREKVKVKILEYATELNLNKSSRNDTAVKIEKLLRAFQTEVYIATDLHGFSNSAEDNAESEEQWTFASALLFAITVMTTIGYGHVAPKTDYGRITTIGYAVFGIPLTLLCLTNIGDLMATGFRMLYAKVCCGLCCVLFSPERRKMPDPEKALDGESIEYQEGKPTDKSPEVINVPTSVCILLMTSYILLGTLLFSIWEGWDAITGTYFSFITLSTIGFGDVVPGTAMNQWENEEKLVLCAMYLVFGLSLIAMCFNLVQEDVKNKCRWLGAKLGIIDPRK